MGIIGTALAVALGLALFYGMRGWISRNGASKVAMTMFGFLLVIGLVAAGGWMLLITNQQAAQAAESAPAPAAIAQKAAPALAPAPDSESGAKPQAFTFNVADNSAKAAADEPPVDRADAQAAHDHSVRSANVHGTINRATDACIPQTDGCITLASGTDVIIDKGAGSSAGKMWVYIPHPTDDQTPAALQIDASAVTEVDRSAPTPSDVREHKVARDHVFAVFEGHGVIPPMILTTEPCRAGTKEPGKRALMLMPGGRMESCWSDNGENRPVAVCEKWRGEYDGRVMGSGACYDIDKQYFLSPASLPRSAFASR